MDKTLPPNKTLSDKIAAEAAKKIEHDYCIGEMDERERERNEIAEIIQSALSQSLAARDKELWALIKEWETGRSGAKSIAGAEVRCAANLRALLKGKAI